AELQFKEQSVDPITGQAQTDPNTGLPEWKPATARGNDGEIKALTGRFLKPNSYISQDAAGRPQVAFEFNSEGAKMFGEVTGRLIGKPLGIFLDDELISAPTVST